VQDLPLTTPEPVADVRALSPRKSGVPTVVTVIVVLGAVMLVGSIVAAIAIPGLLRARMSGNEASAIASLRAINSAQAVYSAQCNGAYAPNLGRLNEMHLLPENLSGTESATRSGYTITVGSEANGAYVTTSTPECEGSLTNYFAYADPITAGTTGTRHFATDASGAIFQSYGPFTDGAVPNGAVPVP
jgi:type II secretory pathway pseudopilin PulG